MSGQRELLNDNDVIFISVKNKEDLSGISHKTFRVKEFFEDFLANNDDKLEGGIEAEVLSK